jgi:asparagine synthase (glutamine-hydrolysing)
VPLLDHRLVELAATIPADIKFRDGTMKHVYKRATRSLVPRVISERTDKMGFPVPLQEWIRGPARDFVQEVFSSEAALGRELFNNRRVVEGLEAETRFGRKTWGLMCLELWQRAFHDREHHFKRLLSTNGKGQLDEGSDHGRGRLYRLPSRRSAAG